MATQEQIQEIIGKAAADAEFRAKLIEDPEAAVREAGYELTAEQAAQLHSASAEELEALLTEVDERMSKSAGVQGSSVSVVTEWPF